MKLLSYSPSHSDPRLLTAITTGEGRKALIDALVEAVAGELGRPSHQHQLVIGPRGSGKTHVLTLVRHRLGTDPRTAGKVRVVHLAEEEVIKHPADLLIRILERLAQQLPEQPSFAVARERVRAHLSRLRAESNHELALALAAAAVEDISSTLGLLLVATVENLDAILFAGAGLSRGTALQTQWGLRRTLLESSGLVVIASAPSSFGEVSDPTAPLFNVLRTHQLDELNSDEMLSLIHARLLSELGRTPDERRQRRLQLLVQEFDERAPKLRGLLTLTGGVPRFGHLIFDLLVDVDAGGVMETLEAFLDEQTPYFQPKLDPRMIPEGELEVLDALASAPGPMTISELAATLRGGSPNAASTYVKRLMARGLVRERRAGPRQVHYDVAEPLFRIWRRFRIGSSEQQQILMLAEFVAAMFSRAELMADRAVLREQNEADARGVELLNHAIELGKQEGPVLAGEEGGASLRIARDALQSGELDRAMELAEQGIERTRTGRETRALGEWLQFRGAVLERLEREEAAQAYADAAAAFAEVGEQWARARCFLQSGDILFQFARWEQAAERYGQAAQASEGDSQFHALCSDKRAHALEKSRKWREAADSFRLAASAYADARESGESGHSLMSCAQNLVRAGDDERATDAYRQSAKALLDARSYLLASWNFYYASEVLARLGRYDDAILELRNAADANSRVRDPVERADSLLRLTHSLCALLEKHANPAPVVDSFTRYLAQASDQSSGRKALVGIALSILATHGAEATLEILPVLESALQGAEATLLRPMRLAAEILAKRRPETLTGEPEEMHRAVAEVLRRVAAHQPG